MKSLVWLCACSIVACSSCFRSGAGSVFQHDVAAEDIDHHERVCEARQEQALCMTRPKPRLCRRWRIRNRRHIIWE